MSLIFEFHQIYHIFGHLEFTFFMPVVYFFWFINLNSSSACTYMDLVRLYQVFLEGIKNKNPNFTVTQNLNSAFDNSDDKNNEKKEIKSKPETNSNICRKWMRTKNTSTSLIDICIDPTLVDNLSTVPLFSTTALDNAAAVPALPTLLAAVATFFCYSK